jgi:hypothetical protein
VWGTVRYLHPYLAYKDIDWDAALLETLPKVEAAKDDEAYRAAVQAMLDQLGDPGTRVARIEPHHRDAPPEKADKEREEQPLFSWIADGVLALHADCTWPRDKVFDPKTWDQVREAFNKADAVVFDIRGEESFTINYYLFGRLFPLLPSKELRAPAERFLIHSGYQPQTGSSSGPYTCAFQTALPQVFKAAPDGKGKRAVFLVDKHPDVSPLVLALQEAGEAFLVSQGELPQALGGIRRSVPLTEGFEVRVRTAEMVGTNGLLQVRADAEVPADAKRGPNGPAFQKALEILRKPPATKTGAKAGVGGGPPLGVWRSDKLYEKMV